ncbi:hypothetical protein H072_8541 [Dactylellina haptotyla CBS 200.50]|uniref:Uncharacterized protein n=1 Tax=Dactylellina haptotyla (strain CBS 200.50) TaxID=1284197 RepID=S8A4Q7_DACHA|nr:hypothetical protein H072_8541 [Dactylellina haptotyla CBS 200.50]
MQEIALTGLKDTGAVVVAFAAKLNEFDGTQEPSTISPFVSDCIYTAAKHYLWYLRETGNSEIHNLANVLLGTLRSLGSRWAVANDYLSILDGSEFKFTD